SRARGLISRTNLRIGIRRSRISIHPLTQCAAPGLRLARVETEDHKDSDHCQNTRHDPANPSLPHGLSMMYVLTDVASGILWRLFFLSNLDARPYGCAPGGADARGDTLLSSGSAEGLSSRSKLVA